MSKQNMYPQLNQQQPPPPQGYQQPPPQGYQQPPPQGYTGAPPQAGYPGQPPAYAQGPYPPQPYQTAPPGQTVIVHQTVQPAPVTGPSQASRTFGSLLSGASKLAKGVGDSVQKSIDTHRSSPTLRTFMTGAILQFINRSNNMALRTHPNGGLDCMGNPAMNDPYTHYKVQNHGNNIVTMNCMANPTFYVTIDKAGNALGNGPGGYESKLRLHETLNGFITFESLQCPNNHLATMPNGTMKPTKMATKDQDSQFSIRVIAAPPGATVQVQQTTVVYK